MVGYQYLAVDGQFVDQPPAGIGWLEGGYEVVGADIFGVRLRSLVGRQDLEFGPTPWHQLVCQGAVRQIL